MPTAWGPGGGTPPWSGLGRGDRMTSAADHLPVGDDSARSSAEAVAVGVVGAVLSGAVCGLVGGRFVGLAAGAVGLANGAVSGWRGVYDLSSLRGRAAFVLDSTWALPTTFAGVVSHAVGRLRGEPGYVHALSHRRNRHVYERGFQPRRGFATTFGNVVNGAGDTSHPRRAKLVTDHEDVHVWQARWFGPLYPVLYVSWMIGGGIGGAVLWVLRRRDQPFTRVVESCAYYLNPFEYWAYSRDAHWPPAGLASGLGPQRPIVRSFAGRC